MQDHPDKLRVVYLIGQLGLGGSERQLNLILKHLDKGCFDCHVVVFNPSEYYVLNDELEANGVRVWQLPERRWGVSSRIRYLYKLFREIRPHIVHSWTVHDNPYAGIIGQLAGVPLTIGSLRSSTKLQGFQSLPPYLRFLSLKSVSKLIVNTESVRKELEEIAYPPRKITVIPNCVDLAVHTADSVDFRTWGIQPHHQVVGTVGNLRAVKNHQMFVRVLAKVIAERSQVRGLIVGQPIPTEPKDEKDIKEQIQRLGLQNVISLTGFQQEVPTFLRRFQIFCLTSISEGLPNAVLEAMAASLPVVATRVGGIPELVVDGVTGILVTPNDDEQFSRAVKYLLDNPDRASEMGLAGKERALKQFSCQKAVERFTGLYYGMAEAAGCLPAALHA